MARIFGSTAGPALMRATIDRAWRLCATGFCFAAFGVGGALLSVTLFPLLRLAAGSRERAQPLVRRALRQTFRLFIAVMKGLRLLTYEIEGRERLLPGGRLIVANHPTLIDVVFLLSLVPDATCVVKRGLWRNPFLRWPVAWAGYIPNSESESLVQQCSASLRAGHSLVMFPEGRRTVPGHALQLKRGAAQIAIASAAEVLPVVIVCEPLTLTREEPWYRIPSRPPHFTIAVGTPVAESVFRSPELPTPIAARHLTQHLAALFTRGTQHVDRAAARAAATNAPRAESASL